MKKCAKKKVKIAIAVLATVICFILYGITSFVFYSSYQGNGIEQKIDKRYISC